MPQKKEKIKQVAALKYSPDNNDAPQIIGLGKGETAEKILEIAKERNIPVYKNEELAQTLNTLNIGEEIPPELYEIVAEILVFIGNLDNRLGDRK
ncbi:MAG: flagellar biogenesis protein [Clostridiaceae bacterium]|nr:flagellar biogenesis protein [Clostridiaceae bacterium]